MAKDSKSWAVSSRETKARVGTKCDLIFMHTLEPLCYGRDMNYGYFIANDWTVPKLAVQLGSFRKGQLWQKEGKDDEDLPKGNRFEQFPCDLREPLLTCIGLTAADSEVA